MLIKGAKQRPPFKMCTRLATNDRDSWQRICTDCQRWIAQQQSQRTWQVAGQSFPTGLTNAKCRGRCHDLREFREGESDFAPESRALALRLATHPFPTQIVPVKSQQAQLFGLRPSSTSRDLQRLAYDHLDLAKSVLYQSGVAHKRLESRTSGRALPGRSRRLWHRPGTRRLGRARCNSARRNLAAE